MSKRYLIENRYQDSNWENAGPNYEFDNKDDAVWAAAKLSTMPIVWGMARVIDTVERSVVIVFPGG